MKTLDSERGHRTCQSRDDNFDITREVEGAGGEHRKGGIPEREGVGKDRRAVLICHPEQEGKRKKRRGVKRLRVTGEAHWR